MYKYTIILLTERYTSLALLLTFLSILILFFINFKEIKKQFKKISKKTWFILILIIILGLYLRINWNGCDVDIVMWEFVFDAEDILLNRPIINIGRSKAYSFLLALTSLFFGLNYNTIIWMCLLTSILTIIPIFLITYLITKSEEGSLLSSLFFSILPSSIILSKSGAAHVYSGFFVSSTILFFLLSIKIKNIKSLTLSIISLVFSIATRLDNVIFIPIFCLCYLIFLKRTEWKKLIIPALAFSLFISQLSCFFYSGNRNYGYESLDPVGRSLFKKEYPNLTKTNTFSLKYFSTNTKANIEFLNNPRMYPKIMYIFIILSLFSIKKNSKVIVIVLWPIAFLTFYGLWFMTFISPINLYQVLIHPAISILAGIGIVTIYEIIRLVLPFTKNYESTIRFILFFMIGSFILYGFYTEIDIFHPNLEYECLSRDVIELTSRINDQSCIIMEGRVDEEPWKNLFSFSRFLIPDKLVVDDIKYCKSKEIYYIKPSESFLDGVEKVGSIKLKNHMFKYLSNNCNLILRNKTSNITIYKVIC